jgi:iron(II)-dependent oxidoreductase
MKPRQWIIRVYIFFALAILSYLFFTDPPTLTPLFEISQIRQLARSTQVKELAALLNRSTVLIPAGNFWMGSNENRSDEKPLHQVYLDAYRMDRYEVTNAQYLLYLQATGARAPVYWQSGQFPDGQADVPVSGLDWFEANAYCTWAGKRLPTEAEWEKACRGSDARIYPWGNQWVGGRANIDASAGKWREVNLTAPGPNGWDLGWELLKSTPGASGQPALQQVGSYTDGKSAFGLYDMAGNVSEWVADWYNWQDYSNIPNRNPLNQGPPWNHSMRGSSWFDPYGSAEWEIDQSRCSARNSSHASAEPRAGVRCASSP